jgi:hypothetical protein
MDQFVPVGKSQETQYPGYARLDTEFPKIQFLCNVTH